MLFLSMVMGALASENMAETMMMMSLYNSVLNFLLMCMAFTTECLMFAFMFSAFLTLSLSCVFAVNVMCMGTGAMTITIILTALALTIATMLSSTSMASTITFPVNNNSYFIASMLMCIL